MSLGPLMTDFDGTSLDASDREILSHPLVGGVILFSRNYVDPRQIQAVTEEIHALRKPKLLIAVDHEGGRVQRFRQGFTHLPAAAAFGEQFDSDPARALALAEEAGWTMATELRMSGVDFSFAPVLDIRNTRSRIIDDRAFHHDPQKVTRIARATIRGINSAGMVAVGKHFPGHGTVIADSHLELPVDDRTYYDIQNKDLVPFRLLARDLGGVMPAHILYPKVDNEPAGYSEVWIKKILRDQLGFQGIVFSDDLSMSGAAREGAVEDRAHTAIEAGCDMILLCNDRPATERLLTKFEMKIEPITQVRLMRMHGKGVAAGIEKLHGNTRWLAARERMAALEQPGELDLGDDMLS